MKRIRIAFVIYGLGTGGAERVVTGLANNFVDTYDVTIITLVKTQPFYFLRPEVALLHCSNKGKTTTNSVQSIFDGLGRTRKIYKFIKRHRIQLVISFMTTSNVYAIWASKWAKIPCIISERANHSIFRLSNLIEKARDLSYKHASLLVVQTNGNKVYYNSILPLDKITVIQNPIAYSLQSKKSLDKVDRSKNIILNVGSFKPGKAQNLLMASFANVPNEDWELVFIGDGPKKEEFMKLAQLLNISNKTSFLGERKDIHNFYNTATLFVFTSEHEGFPNALMEALYFGVPSISTNCPHGPSDLITDGQNGFLIPVGDQKILEKRLLQLMMDVDLQQKFSHNAISSTEKFKMEVIADKWKHHINQLL